MNPSDYQQEFDKIIARKYFDKTLEKIRIWFSVAFSFTQQKTLVF